MVYCGFDCKKCPLYGKDCKGCNQDELIYHYCKECKIRKCAKENKLDNCGRCDKYLTCEHIKVVTKQNINSKEFLDKEYNNR